MPETNLGRSVVAAVRVAADPAALDAASWPADATALRLAPDEVLVLDALEVTAPEPHAIVFPDTGWVRFVLTPDVGRQVMARTAAWPTPTVGLGQGMVAGIPAKVVVGEEAWWMVVLAVSADEFAERLREVVS